VKQNPVKAKLAAGEVAVGAFLAEFATPGIGRLLAAAEADFVLFDQEHTGWSIETVGPLIVGARAASVTPLVRVPAIEKAYVGGILDAGALGVMAPMVESATQAEELVSLARFPPLGRRGVGPMYVDEVDETLDATLERMNRELLVFAMVETAVGVENADAIAAVDGIDLLWVGHGDLTTSLGIPGRFEDQRYLDALAVIVGAARANGKALGMLAVSADEGRQLADKGFDCVAFADRALYDRALREAHAAVRASVAQSSPR